MRDTRARPQPKGFTIIEVLVVVAIIGLISVFLIPNLLDAIQKAKQKRTVATLREVGTAWFSWFTDEVSSAAAGASQFSFGDFAAIDVKDLRAILVPKEGIRYAASVPRTDSWGNDLDYAWSEDPGAPKGIAIRSLGRDGEVGPTTDPYPMGPFAVTAYDEDIVWTDGFFVRYPAGAQVQ